MESLRIFDTYLYEVSKGTKPVALVTLEAEYKEKIETRLKKMKIAYLIQPLECDKFNIFFGKKECISVIKTFIKPLNLLSAEEDFILGTILGYDTVLQCERYLKFKNSDYKSF